MTWHQRQFGISKIPIDNVQVGAADGTGMDGDEHVSRSRLRLRQLGRTENTSLVISAVLRGSYHLYQGFGGFIGNVVLGLVFGRVWQKTNRLWPMVLAHTILDVVSFVGYALLASKLAFLR